MRRTPRLALLVVGGSLLVAACEDEVIVGNNQPPPPPRRGVQASLSAALSASASAAPVSTLNEADFTQSERNRDPFRSYVDVIKPPPDDKNKNRAQSLADRFALDELKLVAIVSGGTAPRAMFVDPEGKGWIVGLGQFLGRPENVKTGGANSPEYELTWKVDRIRENDVVFVRETPGRANIPSATRVIQLRTDDDKSRRR